MAKAIEAQGLVKIYGGRKIALNEFTVDIGEGEIVGLLGPNGAGKSTFINVISGNETANSGRLLIYGKPASKASRGIIGIAPQENAVYPKLTCLENLLYFGSLYGVAGKNARVRAEGLLDSLGLAEKRNVPASDLSGGMRRRLNLACALMHGPKIIILDEPTTGLDPSARNQMWGTVRQVVRDNKATLLLTTHYMEEAEALCTRIVLMNSGKVVADGTPGELKRFAGKEIAKVKSIPGKYEKISHKMLKIKGIDAATPTEHGLVVESQNISQRMQDIAHAFEKNGESIIELSVSRPSLEDVFLKLTGAKLRESAADEPAK